jgi:chromosomal replication initiator protein
VSEQSADGIWADVTARLREDLSETAFSAWFGSAQPVSLEGSRLRVGVPNEFTRAWIDGHFAQLVERAARSAHDELAVEFTVSPRQRRDTAGPAGTPAPEVSPPARGRSANTQGGDEASRFLPKYTFDNFVIGSSNRFSHAAALAVAEAPGQAYNPLVIYGGTGLGKTHLLQAIGRYVEQHASSLRASYVTSEQFTNEMIDALRDKRMDAFKQRYRSSVDVLLVDDIQFLSGRERIQEEFFHTFNALYESGRQVVLSSDRPVKEIPELEERLRSRFEWGLITDVQPPDLETRIAILRRRVKADGARCDDLDVLTAIARRVTKNIRELEGALTRVLAFASLTGRPVSPDLVRETLHDLDSGDAPITIDQIQREVAAAFGLTVAELCSQRRTQEVVHPRQIAMYLCRELTDLSLPRIGEHFGGRDHTTVLYAVNKITQKLREDRTEYNLVRDLHARLKRGA